jgi:hypothetical protein
MIGRAFPTLEAFLAKFKEARKREGRRGVGTSLLEEPQGFSVEF